eukprot:3683127-Rhodomonas_salina.2
MRCHWQCPGRRRELEALSPWLAADRTLAPLTLGSTLRLGAPLASTAAATLPNSAPDTFRSGRRGVRPLRLCRTQPLPPPSRRSVHRLPPPRLLPQPQPQCCAGRSPRLCRARRCVRVAPVKCTSIPIIMISAA